MARELFDLQSLPATRWKNGGGQTRSVVSRPADAGLDDFHWRVSIASISTSGPFSEFPGVDRVIVRLDNDAEGELCEVGAERSGDGGLRLWSDDGRIDHCLDAPLQPFAFAGDVALRGDLHGRVQGATVTAFNLMCRRDRVRGHLRVIHAAETLAAMPQGLLFAARAAWRAHFDDGSASCVLPARTGVWWDRAGDRVREVSTEWIASNPSSSVFPSRESPIRQPTMIVVEILSPTS